ncbi:MAG: LacI family DNA-binding transcriptional regulator [Clostridiales bacterium]|nr:LacI family DNA-binding transcriptional regulator [Clostridiales bacterium]
MKFTMKDVAERCGVSKTLVSRILNDDPTLHTRPATRERVLRVIEEMGYVKNINAQALYIARLPEISEQPNIGYVTFASYKHPGHPYFSHVIEGIIEEAAHSHVQLPFSLSVTEFQQQLPIVLQQYQEHPLDGLILLGAVNDKLRRVIPKITRHVVSLDGQFDKNSDYVGVDTSRSILLGLEHLLNLGYTDIGLLCGGNDKRLSACKRCLWEHGLEANANWIINGEFSVDIAYERVTTALQSYRPPRAIVAYNDEMAIGCIKALQKGGWRVPEDVAVTGHDDISLAAYVDVPLTTVRVYKKEIGRLAVKILLDRIETKRKNAVLLEVPGKLIKRDSCGWRKV